MEEEKKLGLRNSEQNGRTLDFGEGQRWLRGLADKDYRNKGARGTAVESIAEAFGRGWTIGEYPTGSSTGFTSSAVWNTEFWSGSIADR